MEQPIGQLTLPVEIAALNSHLGLQFGFSRREHDGRAAENGFALALRGQYAAADIFEVGIALPVVVHGWVGGLQNSGDATEFGNLCLDLKAKLAGASRGPYALAFYANTTLPTTTAELSNRDFAGVQAGLAATLQRSLVTAGMATGPWVLIFGGHSDEVVIYTFDWFVALRLHAMVALQLALQLALPVGPASGDAAVAVNPALSFYLVPALHLDAGARIAATDVGRIYTGGGRASLLLALAYDY